MARCTALTFPSHADCVKRRWIDERLRNKGWVTTRVRSNNPVAQHPLQGMGCCDVFIDTADPHL
jgi:hypothetical protein